MQREVIIYLNQQLISSRKEILGSIENYNFPFI